MPNRLTSGAGSVDDLHIYFRWSSRVFTCEAQGKGKGIRTLSGTLSGEVGGGSERVGTWGVLHICSRLDHLRSMKMAHQTGARDKGIEAGYHITVELKK